MNKIIACFGAIGLLSASPGMAQKTPERIRLTATSREGAVLLRVPVQPFDYALQFSRNGHSGFMSRVYLMRVRAGPPGFRYIARTLSPGQYRLDSVWQQGRWSACLEQGTFEFPVTAGHIAFVGTLNLDPVLATIQQRALQSERTSIGGGDYFLTRPDAARPIIGGRDDASVADARQFAEVSMNRSGALLELTDVSEASFATSGLGQAIKVCG